MKNHMIRLLVLAFLTVSFGCYSSGESASNEPPVENSETPGEVISNDDPQETKKEPQKEVFRLILSFISIGEGTDYEAKKRMDGYLDKWYAETEQTIAFDSKAWGREGEVDYCFRLNELSTEQQEKFVAGITEAIGDTELVHITENQTFQHAR